MPPRLRAALLAQGRWWRLSLLLAALGLGLLTAVRSFRRRHRAVRRGGLRVPVRRKAHVQAGLRSLPTRPTPPPRRPASGQGPPDAACAAELVWRGAVLGGLLRRAGLPEPPRPELQQVPPRIAQPPQPEQAGSEAAGIALGAVSLRKICALAHEPFSDLVALRSAGENSGTLVRRLLNQSQGQLQLRQFRYDADGRPLGKRQARISLALITPEDVLERATELRDEDPGPWLNQTTWIEDRTYLTVFTYGRSTRLLWNLNHMLNRLLPALWTAQRAGSERMVIPWAPDVSEGRMVGALPLFAQFVAVAAAGLGIAVLLVLPPLSHEAVSGMEPPAKGRCSALCFRDLAMGQPRWAPSAAVRRALLRALRPGLGAPPPRGTGGLLCERMAEAERSLDPFAPVPFRAAAAALEPGAEDGEEVRGLREEAAAAPAETAGPVRAVILERATRRRFGPAGLRQLQWALLTHPASKDWVVAVANTTDTAGNTTLAEQAAPYVGADVLIAASGAGLSWAFLLAPGSVVLEVAPWKWCSVPDPGLNQASARRGEATSFGGLVRSAGLNHVGIAQLWSAEPLLAETVNIPTVRVHPKAIRRALAEAAAALARPAAAYCSTAGFPPEFPLPGESYHHKCRINSATGGPDRPRRSVRPPAIRRRPRGRR
eukprot:TRINITY_DN14938_c0_g1_i1.p1 TRINITY_DN14938_c0_g1~~TRINITY_DN14938_c0_g1_i1.p1  ORF type:complete len:685 (+),score=128.41 TRINITY_DN14938_c0_g1_i1:82-2055(+)